MSFSYFKSFPVPMLGILIVFISIGLWNLRGMYLFLTRKSRYKFLPKYGGKLQKMKNMDWKDFEFLCEELFRVRGWKTSCSNESGADGGVDVWLKRRDEVSLVQCKRYKNTSVGVKVVRELYGLMTSHSAQSGYIVTTSYFTKEAYKFAKGKRISLINGKELEKISEKLKEK